VAKGSTTFYTQELKQILHS